MLSVVPKNHTARWLGAGARLRLPRFAQRWLIRWFVWKYGVDLSECEGKVEDFESLAHFFVRALKPGMRTIDPDPTVLVSPVDGTVHTFGDIDDGMFLQAPGLPCPVVELVGPDLAPSFDGGSFAVLYLSPPDYHRVHSPSQGRIQALDYRPGKLWPVFPAATRKVRALFARNERLVFDMDTEAGRCALVMVGAFGVGRIANVVNDMKTNTGDQAECIRVEPPREIARGEEVGRFELGSTVILLYAAGRVRWTLTHGESLRMGRPIGVLTEQ